MEKDTFVTRLCEILVKNGSLSHEEAQAMEKSFEESEQERFDQFLLDEGIVDTADILRALSVYYHVPSFDVDGYFFEPHLLHMFPKDFLLRNRVVPLEVDENILIVVAGKPELPGLASAMREFVSYDITFLVGLERSICDAIKEYYDAPLTEDIEVDQDLRVEHMTDRFVEGLEEEDIDDIVKPRY